MVLLPIVIHLISPLIGKGQVTYAAIYQHLTDGLLQLT